MATLHSDKPNPFQILGLPTDAPKPEIVERGQELDDLAQNDDERQLYRWAIEQLITHPFDRLMHELFEVPDAVYEIPDWDRFTRLHRLPPRPGDLAAESTTPTPEDYDVEVLVGRLLAHLLEVSEPGATEIIEASPFESVYGPCPLEVRDVIAG